MSRHTQRTEIDLTKVKELFESHIPFLRKVGIVVESITTGHIKLGIPFNSENLNHFGTYQGGVYLTLAEAAGGALLATVIDLSENLLLTKECHLKFGHPARNYLSYEGTLSEKDCTSIMEGLERDRKIDFPLHVTLLNEKGKVSAEASLVYYLRSDQASFIHMLKKTS